GFARGRIPQPDAAVVVASRQPFPIRADRHREHSFPGDGKEVELLNVFRTSPEFDLAIAAGGKEIALGTERERMHQVAMSHAKLVPLPLPFRRGEWWGGFRFVPWPAVRCVKSGFKQLRVGQSGDELLGGNVIDE